MTAAEAETAIAAIAAIAADWREATAGRIPAGPSSTLRKARLATLRAARDRTEQMAERAADALLRVLPPKQGLLDRVDLIREHQQGNLMSTLAEAWVRAVDYADGVAAMLWWEDGRGGKLRIVCQINADLRAAQQAGRAEAA